MSVIRNMNVIIENYKIIILDNGYLIEFRSGNDIRKLCFKTRDEAKEFIYNYWFDKVETCGYIEVEAKIKI